jgi:hypothetical protein
MTHEYVIALRGRIDTGMPESDDAGATAIAWAADHVLAVGPDDVVRSISRGDSTFLDLGGCVVTALPEDAARADAVVSAAAGQRTSTPGIGGLLKEAGLLDRDASLEPGSPADLAIWQADLSAAAGKGRPAGGLVAVVRGGAFTEGDEHYGPFPKANDSP